MRPNPYIQRLQVCSSRACLQAALHSSSPHLVLVLPSKPTKAQPASMGRAQLPPLVPLLRLLCGAVPFQPLAQLCLKRGGLQHTHSTPAQVRGVLQVEVLHMWAA
jgi:hypothetical protein